MEDSGIVDLYWARDERALEETEQKYGCYCRTISFNILKNQQDAEECVNDTYVQAWNTMPPQRPTVLSAFLGAITRNLSLNCYRDQRRKRRGGGQILLALDELEQLADRAGEPEQRLEAAEMARLLDRFLRELPRKDCCVFLRRYWYVDSVLDIAQRYHMAEGSVKSSLYRTRQKLRAYLEQEGIPV